jgi:hypothetical protein
VHLAHFPLGGVAWFARCRLPPDGVALASALPAPPLQIPYFNAPIFLENKTQVGKVDEILGQINSVVGGAGEGLGGSGVVGGVQGVQGAAQPWLALLRLG